MSEEKTRRTALERAQEAMDKAAERLRQAEEKEHNKADQLRQTETEKLVRKVGVLEKRVLDKEELIERTVRRLDKQRDDKAELVTELEDLRITLAKLKGVSVEQLSIDLEEAASA